MTKTLITTALFLVFLCSPPSAMAEEFQAVQGDVKAVESSLPADSITLGCFGKKWPVKRLADGRWRGWIGVDMKTEPGSYDVEWSSHDRKQTDTLLVQAGEFRISRIDVPKKMAEFDAKTLARINREVKKLIATYSMDVDANPDIAMTQPPVEGEESTPFGAQRYVNGEPRSPHSGIDIAAPEGAIIKAPLAGKVLMVLGMYLNGNTVVLGHGNGLVSVYCHLRSTPLHEGEWVETGATLGEVGMTGRATGPHLHWGIRFNNARINPDSLLRVASHAP